MSDNWKGTVRYFSINRSPEEYFKYYKKYEIYDHNKTYDCDLSNEQMIFNYIKYNNEILKYVSWQEIISDEERKDLQIYCKCAICDSYFFDPIRWFKTRQDVGCLKICTNNPTVIEKAREKKKKIDDYLREQINKVMLR